MVSGQGETAGHAALCSLGSDTPEEAAAPGEPPQHPDICLCQPMSLPVVGDRHQAPRVRCPGARWPLVEGRRSVHSLASVSTVTYSRVSSTENCVPCFLNTSGVPLLQGHRERFKMLGGV